VLKHVYDVIIFTIVLLSTTGDQLLINKYVQYRVCVTDIVGQKSSMIEF